MEAGSPPRTRRMLSPLRPNMAWRTLAYVVTAAAVGLLTLVSLPVTAVLGGLVATPLAALPLGALERRRVALLSANVLPSPHRRPDRPGLAAWLRLRYAEAATWREFAYAIVLATLLWPIDAFAAAAVGALGYVTFVDPLVDPAGGERWLISLGLVVPWVGSLYLARGVATGHAALARILLGGETELAVRELTRSRIRLVDAFESERRRIERDLHDGAQQRLIALTMTLGLARLELNDGPAAARSLVDQATDQVSAVLDELRRLVRGIHPRVLTEHGLPAAVAELAGLSTVPVDVAMDIPDRLPSTVEATAYYVVAEVLANAAKHAHATSVTIAAGIVDQVLAVRIGDDGVGGADPAGGSGLAGLADRVAALDGTLTLTSPPGGGTVVGLRLPCYVS
jgi:signal transduction histidine kinase